MSNTRFVEINIESFLGINPNGPLTVIFPEDWSRVALFSGDQETGKTSALKAIEATLGAVFPDYYLNVDTKDQKGWTRFIVDDVEYRSKLTKNSIKLEQKALIANKEKWIATGEDKTLIRKLMPYATSPEILTEFDGDKQLKWLKELAGAQVDDSKLTAEYKIDYDKRTLKNKEVQMLRTQLIESGGYTLEAKDVIPTPEFEIIKQKVSETDVEKIIEIRANELKQKEAILADVNKAKSAIERYTVSIEEKNKSIDGWRKQIEEILKTIENTEIEIKAINDRITAGNEYIETNKEINTQVTEAQVSLKEVVDIRNQKEGIEKINKLYETYKKSFDEAIALTSNLDRIKEDILALAKSFTPDIEGFEVQLGNIEKEKGLYLNGINISTLSESQRYQLCIKIWEYYKIRVVFIENITSLGSKAIEIIKLFLANGGTVFATQMDRTQQVRKLSFTLNDQ